MRRRSPPRVIQWPTCGLGRAVSHTPASTSLKAGTSSGGITKSRASRPITSAAAKPVARSQASLKERIWPSRSRTQTSDCVVSESAAANAPGSISTRDIGGRQYLGAAAATDRIGSLGRPERSTMDLFEQVDAARERWNVLRHPFYLRWEAGELSRAELAFYAGEYRHAVVALADAATVSGDRAHAEEESAHVDLWDDFAGALDAPLDR